MGALLLALTLLLGTTGFALVTPAEAAVDSDANYGDIKSDFSGMTPDIAQAYLSVLDDYVSRFGYDTAGDPDGEEEYIHGGFVRDWDNDGVPELCLILWPILSLYMVGPRQSSICIPTVMDR